MATAASRFRAVLPFLLAAIVTLIAAAALLVVGELQRERRQEAIRSDVLNQLSTIRARLESALSSPLLLTRGIVADIVVHGGLSNEHFESFAAVLIGHSPSIRNFTLARGTVIVDNFPLPGNEKAIGKDYRDQPHQWPAVERAIETRRTVVAGPVELIQGGLALIGRTPIFLSDQAGGDDHFYGLISVVVNIPTVLAEAGLDVEDPAISVAIRGRDGTGADGPAVFGDQTLFSQHPVEQDVLLPDGSWRMAAVPKGGWQRRDWDLRPTKIFGGMMVLFVALASFSGAFNSLQQQATQARIADSERLYRTLSAELETRVDERTRALREAILAAEASNRAKSVFLAHMSHELRTPLNAIIGFSDAIASGVLGSCDDRGCRGNVAIIHRSGLHLLDLINEILDMAKVESGTMTIDPEPVAVDAAIREAVDVLRPQWEAGAVTMSYTSTGALPQFLLDRRRLKQMLLNLLSNAVKFTPKGGSIAVRAEIETDGWLVVEVTDTGIGIPPDDLPLVQEPFHQGSNVHTRTHQGTGLGLPLTKRMAELHGGQFALESTPGKGTTATLRFPPDRAL